MRLRGMFDFTNEIYMTDRINESEEIDVTYEIVRFKRDLKDRSGILILPKNRIPCLNEIDRKKL